MASRTKALPHKNHYYGKLLRSGLTALVILIGSLAVGTIGYHVYFEIAWVDSFYNASLILTGMGPVDKAPSDAAKIFASVYAIYSGVAFLSSIALVFSPIAHRFLHRFRLDVEE